MTNTQQSGLRNSAYQRGLANIKQRAWDRACLACGANHEPGTRHPNPPLPHAADQSDIQSEVPK